MEEGFELRASSRGDGLVFLTALAGGQLQWQQGSIDLQLLARGTLANPIVNGFLRVGDGAFSLAGQSVEAVQATTFFDFQQLQLERFTARSGEGSIEGQGSLAFRQEGGEPGLNFTIKAFPISRPDARLQVDGSLKLQGSLRQPALGGEVKLSQGSITVSPANSAPVVPGRPINQAMPELDWDFQQPVVVRGPQMESADGAALRRRVPNFGPLRIAQPAPGCFGPKLRIAAPPVADFHRWTAHVQRPSGP